MPANLEKSTVATGLEKISFHSNPKEGQCQRTCKLLHNSTLARSCSKSSKPGFNSTWTMMFKTDLEKAEEPEIKLPTSAGSSKSKRVPEKHLLLLYWLCQSLWQCHNKLWKILQEMWIPDHLICLLRNLYVGQEATVRTGHGTTDYFQIGKEVHQGCILSPCLFNLYAEKCQAGWSISWNQDCQEKYQ